MSDQPIGQQPQLSQERIATYREVLSRPGFEQADPITYNRIKAHIDNALAVTGQQLNPPPDPRTPQQIWYDTSHAMIPSPQLVEACVRDSKIAADPAKTKVGFEKTGRSYSDALRQAQHCVDIFPELRAVKVENLPPELLSSLALHWLHYDKFQDQRP